ncbi:hypothetical protein [uncultured Roseibium sp.]|uniref:hypothetical protein n=1 Tax=uncultured Roseibium sp. TaxID=1936171 RepID=UPI002636612F|nr:hypothetical protein [uncultured Roseibium sp.]
MFKELKIQKADECTGYNVEATFKVTKDEARKLFEANKDDLADFAEYKGELLFFVTFSSNTKIPLSYDGESDILIVSADVDAGLDYTNPEIDLDAAWLSFLPAFKKITEILNG